MRAKKSLGQNFLQDEKIIEKIISTFSPHEKEIVLEIGPGEGVLTEKLAVSGAYVIAIEIDERCVFSLKKKFESFENVDIIHGDILQSNIGEIIKKRCEKLGISMEEGEIPYRVIGNLPYYITSAIIRMFLELKQGPSQMFFMVQREVADRICAIPGDMSILSVAVQYFSQPEILFIVPKESFYPIPKVESAFIYLKKSFFFQEENFVEEDEKIFFRLVKIGFSARRKTLVNNISNGLHREKKDIEKILQDLQMSLTIRPQNIEVREWGILMEKLKKFL
ncbi:MAG: ribosomal RNA small subunit methyltransferase A [Candidatus Moranbacteria bacterium]|nr:ribosomal RNA small subunit methyltransferase A [Candidatus Moranbacteria bacterium]